MYTIEFISGPIPFYFTVVKLYLQPESTEESTPYNAVEYKEPARIDKPMSLFQKATP